MLVVMLIINLRLFPPPNSGYLPALSAHTHTPAIGGGYFAQREEREERERALSVRVQSFVAVNNDRQSMRHSLFVRWRKFCSSHWHTQKG